jgi:aminodeoxychorismate synthase component I
MATSPARVLAALLRENEYAFWLDPSLRRGDEGRFSAVGVPYAVFRARRGSASSRRAEWEFFRLDGARRKKGRGNPWRALREIFHDEAERRRRAKRSEKFSFAGGVVGYMGYDLKDFLENFPHAARRDLALDDCRLLFVRDFHLWDHRTGRVHTVGKPGAAPSARPPSLPRKNLDLAMRSATSKRAYLAAVGRIKRHIARGDVYQINLTHRLSFRLPAHPLALYLAMRRENPTPYGTYLACGETHIASTSPERFLRVEGRRALSEPMKGTAPRGRTRTSDARLRRALRASEKNRAENLMITDLVRNDLGRVCRPGSVKVSRLFHVDTYRTLHQMISSVEGTLAPGRDAWDALEALFPPGSMTGAPKIRAVSLIEEIEPVKRGVYAGALGWMDFRGHAQWSVVIRTLVAQNGKGYYHTGGGIVADSEAEDEWRESMLKAEALRRAAEGKG